MDGLGKNGKQWLQKDFLESGLGTMQQTKREMSQLFVNNGTKNKKPHE
jgi:hypothetical protein